MNTLLTSTSDGSHTLYVKEIDESYHSLHGAIQESSHVYINAGLMKCNLQSIQVLEIGFGTGLNTFLTALYAATSGLKISYTTLEKFPLSMNKVLQLNYGKLNTSFAQRPLFEKIHTAKWEQEEDISECFSLQKINSDFTSFQLEKKFDVVYFDAFSPEKQPEMWTEDLFRKIYLACNDNAILTTYCAKGTIRRCLEKVGFTVERLDGPPGKREMIRAIRF
jgi:tRNA U34 5-methylaminomethyl-2-thiouridine-forming methyltransferase MnmC